MVCDLQRNAIPLRADWIVKQASRFWGLLRLAEQLQQAKTIVFLRLVVPEQELLVRG